MSRFKEFIKKHSEIFNIRFGVITAVLILCVVLLITFRERPEEDEFIQDDPVPPIGEINDDPQLSDDMYTDEKVTDDNIFEFLTLGQYIGIPIDKAVVGQQDIDDFIEQHLADFATFTEVHDRAVQNGDVVVIDFSGSIDGVVFEGGTDQGVELEIGSNSFIPGFEDQIIGHYVGEQFDITVPFPDNYHVPDLAGKDAVFAINLVAIYTIQLPELNLDFVRDLGMGFDSIEEYKDFMKGVLEERTQTRMHNWEQIERELVESTVFHKLPNNEIEQHILLLTMQVWNEAAMYGFDDLEEFIFLATEGMFLEDFTELVIKPLAKHYVEMELIIRAIAVKEGITISEAELEEMVSEIPEFSDDFIEIAAQTFESFEHFIEAYTRVYVKMDFLMEKIVDFLIDSAVAN